MTVGYASGEIPRIPLNLVLLKGIQVLGFQFLTFATHAPDEMLRNDAELMELLADGQSVPHIGATFAFADVVAALQLRRRRQGRRQGPPHHPLNGSRPGPMARLPTQRIQAPRSGLNAPTSD